MTNSNMTCEEFDAALPDHLEGTLDEPLRASVAKHLSECVRCASLVRDLDKIRKEAASMPDLVPSRDLWQGIEARIAAPVIPLTARPEPKRRFAPAWMGVAAAALILVTAGITYTLTARSFQGGTPTVAQVTPASNPAPASSGSDTGVTGPSPTTSPSETGGTGARAGTPPSTAVASESSPRRPASIARVVNQQVSEDVYSREIAMLQKIVTDRRTQLDSSTVAIIERNLRIIDAAIAQSRAALANDPASRLLSDQLTHALDKKVELLRTAALLPSA
jgi:anti-sigma factor RsiW